LSLSYLSQEWAWAAAVIAIPVIVLGVFEMAQVLRRRRFEAIARRSKDGRPSGSRSGRSG
jgi:hypothetical protein